MKTIAKRLLQAARQLLATDKPASFAQVRAILQHHFPNLLFFCGNNYDPDDPALLDSIEIYMIALAILYACILIVKQ